MSVVVDMRRRKADTLDEMVSEIHRQFDEAMRCEKKAYSARIYTGQLLLELRARIEAGEAGDNINWWEWHEAKFVRSRRDAEKVMALAKADDPEAAHEQEKAKAREGMRQRRAANVSRDPDPDNEPGDDERSDDAPCDNKPKHDNDPAEDAEDISPKPPTQRQLRRLFLSQAGLACQAALQPYVLLRPRNRSRAYGQNLRLD
jgi:hypothetical protein